MLRDRLQRELGAARARGEPPMAGVWGAVTAQSAAMKGLHALELIETQGVDALRDFFLKQETGKGSRRTPSQKAFLDDPDVVRVQEALRTTTVEHPKIAKTIEIVATELRKAPDSRALVFSQYRETARPPRRTSFGPCRTRRFAQPGSWARPPTPPTKVSPRRSRSPSWTGSGAAR